MVKNEKKYSQEQSSKYLLRPSPKLSLERGGAPTVRLDGIHLQGCRVGRERAAREVKGRVENRSDIDHELRLRGKRRAIAVEEATYRRGEEAFAVGRSSRRRAPSSELRASSNVVPLRSVQFHSVSFRFVSFRFASLRSSSIRFELSRIDSIRSHPT